MIFPGIQRIGSSSAQSTVALVTKRRTDGRARRGTTGGRRSNVRTTAYERRRRKVIGPKSHPTSPHVSSCHQSGEERLTPSRLAVLRAKDKGRRDAHFRTWGCRCPRGELGPGAAAGRYGSAPHRVLCAGLLARASAASQCRLAPRRPARRVEFEGRDASAVSRARSGGVRARQERGGWASEWPDKLQAQ